LEKLLFENLIGKEFGKMKKKVLKKLSQQKVIIPLVLIMGLILVNSSILKVESTMSAKESAKVVANFIVSEYQRQQEEVGEANLEEIVDLSKKLDDTRSLEIAYSDTDSDKSFIIFTYVDGKAIKYESVMLD